MLSKRRIVILGLLLTAVFVGLIFIKSETRFPAAPTPTVNLDLIIPDQEIQNDIEKMEETEQDTSAQPIEPTPILPILTEPPADLINAPEDSVSEQPSEPIPSMPIITEAHQGFTYRPGQVVTILTTGFKPGDSLEARLIHAEQGQIATYTVSPVSPRGNVPVYLPVESQDAATHPDGAYTLLVSGSDGTQKEYAFSLDYRHLAEAAPFEGCGIYPEPVLDSIVFVWCAGYEPHTSIDIRGLVDGKELFADVVNTIYLDGVALYVLDIFADDPAGEWRLEIGQDTLTFEVGD